MAWLNKRELKYILYSGGFAFIWFFIALPFLLPKFDGNAPFIQFLIFNIGLYIFFFIFLKGLATNKFNWTGTWGLVLLIIALDIFLPPYHVNFQGELLTGTILSTSSSDYLMGFLASRFLKGTLVFVFTYVIAPIIFLLFSAMLLPDFIRRI